MISNEIILIALVAGFALVLLTIVAPYIVQLRKRFQKASTFRKLGPSTQKRIIQQVFFAVEKLAATKTGAIITIANNINLDNYHTDGVTIDANISSQLLIAIFNKESPLHDGAVVIVNSKIVYASAYFKITDRSIRNEFGARHRAALGISEQTDALTIVVSEQSGKVSFTKTGQLIPIELPDFEEKLIEYLTY